MGNSRSVVLLLTIAEVVSTSPSRADPSSADRTLAAALFREGRALIDKGEYGAACAKLEESQRLDPGGGTILNLALCHEKQGKVATAWGEFIEALGIARRDHRQARVDLAEDHIGKLEPLLSKMTIVVPRETDEPSLEVTRDGAVVGRAAWGMPFPVDAGEHRVQAIATGKATFQVTVTVPATGPATLTVRIPPLERDSTTVPAAPLPAAPNADAPIAEAPRASPTPAPAQAPVAPVPPAAPEPEHSSRAGWAWGTIGLGGAGIIAGSALGAVAISKKNGSHDRCPSDPCDLSVVQMSRDAGKFADYATVGFAVGLTALAGGVILLLTDGGGAHAAQGPSRTWAVLPAAGPAGASLDVRGRF